MSLLFDEQFTLILDDDHVPDHLSFANALRLLALHDNHALIGSSGRVLQEAPIPHQSEPKLLINGLGQKDWCCDTRADWVGGSWLFPTLFSRALFAPGAWAYSLQNGEDISFSIIAQRFLNAPVMVPQTADEHGTRIRESAGNDGLGVSKLSNHYPLRLETLQYWRSRGWRGICPQNPPAMCSTSFRHPS